MVKKSNRTAIRTKPIKKPIFGWIWLGLVLHFEKPILFGLVLVLLKKKLQK